MIGAGPYGLATAPAAPATGIEPLVVGEPMEFWRRNVPAGMLLRSSVDWHLDSQGHHTLATAAATIIAGRPIESASSVDGASAARPRSGERRGAAPRGPRYQPRVRTSAGSVRASRASSIG